MKNLSEYSLEELGTLNHIICMISNIENCELQIKKEGIQFFEFSDETAKVYFIDDECAFYSIDACISLDDLYVIVSSKFNAVRYMYA